MSTKDLEGDGREKRREILLVQIVGEGRMKPEQIVLQSILLTGRVLKHPDSCVFQAGR